MSPRDRARLAWIHEMARRILDSLHARANDLGTRAGLGTYRNVWHNAIVALECGTPWRGVDYTLVREAIRVDEASRAVWTLEESLVRSMLMRIERDRRGTEARHAA